MEAVLILAFLVIGGLYVTAVGLRRVPGDMVGIVNKQFGMRRHPDDNPQISVYGAAGVQAETIRPNAMRWRLPFLYAVTRVPLTHVPNGTIGLVVAKAGLVKPPGRPLARYVECSSFQDGAAFIKGRGEQGRQQQVLTGGYYAINTELFEVITVDTPEALARERLRPEQLHDIAIPIGETGVVITQVGEPPPHRDPESVGPLVPGHQHFQVPWEFIDNHGQLGVQQETLDAGGRYSINPWFAHIIRIPTRILILEWSKDKKSDSNFDASLDQIVLDVQGHTVRLDMKQTVRIPVEAAPGLVVRFGTAGDSSGRDPVREFVNKELAATIDGYFRRISAKYRIKEFITRYDEVCNELASEVRQALAPAGVMAVTTTLEEFECAEPEINELRREIALQQERPILVRARRDELEQERENELIISDIERGRIALERERLQANDRDLVELQLLIEKLGAKYVQMERMLGEYVKANVPGFVSGDGNMAEALLQVMPLTQARDLLMRMAEQLAVTNGQAGQES
jgi:hypothetical protein